MSKDHLISAVQSRFRELGLPPSLIEIDAFRDHFLLDHWVMFVRDQDQVTDVHLFDPRQGNQPSARQENRPGPGRKRSTDPRSRS